MNPRSRSTRVLVASLLLLASFQTRLQAQPAETGPRTLTLARALELAFEHAPQLAAARATAEEDAAGRRLAEDAFKPELSLTTTPGYSASLPLGEPPAVAGIALRTSLYDPAQRSQAFEARARAAASHAAYGGARREIAREVAGLYARVWLQAALGAGAERRLAALDHATRRLEALEREGRATALELEQARLRAARARQALAEVRSEGELARLELRGRLDWPADQPLQLAQELLEDLPAPGPAATLEAARASDPERRGLEDALEALAGAARLRERRVQPVIAAGAQYARLVRTTAYDRLYLSFKADDWSVGLSLAVPLWTGGRQAHAAARAQAGRERLAARGRARDLELELGARRAEQAVERAQARAELARRSVRLAEEELRVTRALAAEGRGGPNDADDRDAALGEALAEAARAEVDLFGARVDLAVLRGELPGAP